MLYVQRSEQHNTNTPIAAGSEGRSNILHKLPMRTKYLFNGYLHWSTHEMLCFRKANRPLPSELQTKLQNERQSAGSLKVGS